MNLKILSPDCLASSHLRRRIKRHDDGPEKDIRMAVGFFSLEPTVVAAEQSCPAWAQLSLTAAAYDIGRQQGYPPYRGICAVCAA